MHILFGLQYVIRTEYTPHELSTHGRKYQKGTGSLNSVEGIRAKRVGYRIILWHGCVHFHDGNGEGNGRRVFKGEGDFDLLAWL